jgi:beta-phosphoglucomutase-like phosphatase (HAD superfamily)
MAETIAESIGFTGFAAIIGGDDVEHSKPHPQPYLLGAAALGVAPGDCVALEDSAPGVASAVAAGAVVIAVPMHLPLAEHPSYDLREMTDLRASELFDIYAARHA